MSDPAYMDHWMDYYRRMLRQSQQSANPDMDKVMEVIHHVFQPDKGRDIDCYGSGHWDPETLVYHTKRVFTVLNSFTESSDDNADWNKDTARTALDEIKVKEKAEKKRLKKKRQKERKRLEKQKEQPNNSQDDKGDKTTQVSNSDKEYLNLREMATALESESSNYASDASGEDEEELDLTSSFVTKAADIAKRKLAQKQEIKDKKKSPVKDEPKTPEKTHDIDKDKVDTDTDPSSPKMEDFVKMSAEFASIGNKYAGAGDYETAVRFFTDAIKYNPIEYRLFGNRAFCFERLQEYEKALGDAELSLCMCPTWDRGLFRKGRALAGLKRYEEAAGAFQEILGLNGSSSEAVQELMNVQISQLMESGFSWEQSSKALVVHGSVEKAREALSNQLHVSSPAPVPVRQVANVNGVSPGLSAKAAASAAPPPLHLLPPALGASKIPPPKKEPLIPVQEPPSQAKPEPPAASMSGHVVQAPELFPVWVGNLSVSVTEELLRNIFNKVGTVYSVKVLPAKRCAFINYTQQQQCDVAIRRYHGFELMGSKLAVRYPDRIPPGLNISKAAYKADDLHDHHLRYNLYATGRNARFYPNYRDPQY